MEELEDNQLVKLACNGDEQAFSELLERHYNTVFRIAFKWCGNKENAEDITQNVCVKLARSIQSYKQNAAFTSWLYRLVINTAIDWQRQNKRHDGVEHKEEMGQAMGSAEDALYAREVLQQIDTLPEKEKMALLCVFGEGMTHQETAAVMECKESTVSWYIHEARKKLKPDNKTGKEGKHHG